MPFATVVPWLATIFDGRAELLIVTARHRVRSDPKTTRRVSAKDLLKAGTRAHTVAFVTVLGCAARDVCDEGAWR